MFFYCQSNVSSYICGVTNDKQTKTNNMKKEEIKFIEWGNKLEVIETIQTVEELGNSEYLSRYAKNFGYEHLVNRELVRLENGFKKIFITKTNPKFNYGLDFKIFVYYTADKGMNFLREVRLGGASITSRPLELVRLNDKTPAGFLDFFTGEKLTEDQVKEYHKMSDEFHKNIELGLIDSIEFATNVWYKKDAQHRPELRRMSIENKAIFA